METLMDLEDLDFTKVSQDLMKIFYDNNLQLFAKTHWKKGMP